MERYPTYDTWTYAIFLLPLAGGIGIPITPLMLAFGLILFSVLQLSLVVLLMGNPGWRQLSASLWVLPIAFLMSGFSALIYQIVWQRVLFADFGINIESITIIVTIFMFGLGIGSLAGGSLSRRYPAYLPQLFMACELLIGLFGLVSLRLIDVVSHAAIHGSLPTISLAVFGLLFLPTLLMGATLPILVTYLHRHYRNVGISVGILYFINTLGAAIACFMTADLFFVFFGRQATVFIAATGNFLIGCLVYLHTRSLKSIQEPAVSFPPPLPATDIEGKSAGNGAIRFSLILLLSCVTGYISLSQEILWFRAISYLSGGKPVVFAHVLGFFLLGIALGALYGKRLCRNERDIPLTFIAAMLALSAIIYYASMPLSSHLLIVSEPLGMLASYLLVGIVAFLVGGIFPLLCHIGIIAKDSVGLSMSWIYFANIIGSTAGPLITGFFLLDHFTLERNMLYISIFTLLVATVIFLSAPLSSMRKSAVTVGTLLAAVGMFASHNTVYAYLLEKLQFKSDSYLQGRTYKYTFQNRSGIIAVEGGNPDLIYGGGVYDGKFSTDPVLNANGITRAYMIAALHPHPEEVLAIGLSSGSWARVLSDYSDLKRLTVVEINPGYLEIIGRYPAMATLLSDPRVSIATDDGRRWLKRNTDRKFDLILMNTTFHWRDGSTNLLSADFLRICKDHLKERGVIYYNTTGSKDVIYTAARVFRHIARYDNFVAASDAPFDMDKAAVRHNLLKFRDGGVPVFTRDSRSRGVLAAMVSSDLSDKGNEYRGKKGLRLISDDNMVTEFKTGTIRPEPKESWASLVKKIWRDLDRPAP
jgi:spermidine synthase